MLNAVQSENWPDEVKLLVIGDGQETPAVRKAAAKTDRILHLGRLPYREVAPYVGHAMAGLVIIDNPDKRSSTGVLPLKLYETLACGIPAIVTDLPGQADLIREHDCGFVISVNDSQALVDIVNRIHKSPQDALEKGHRGRVVVDEQHSWFARSQQTLTFIQDSISQCHR